MNDELQRQLALFIESSKEVAINGVNFLSGEVPEVIRQLLMWKAVQSGLMFVVGILFVFFALFTRRWAKTTLPEEIKNELVGMSVSSWVVEDKVREYIENTDIRTFLIPFTLAFIGTVLILFNLVWLQILIAPKLYLMEYLARLLR